MDNQNTNENVQTQTQEATKFCKRCGGKILEQAVICPLCGCQIEEMNANQNQQPIVINNNNSASSSAAASAAAVATGMGYGYGRMRNKWVALLLCILIGYLGAHKFYEGKAVMGIVYLFTFGIFGIGWFIDIIILACKPNPYYVN